MEIKKKKLFNYEEVNQLIPLLEQKFVQLLTKKRELAKLSKKLRHRGIEPVLIGDVKLDYSEDINQLQYSVQNCYKKYREVLFELEKMGGNITDLELGRVEFPAKIEGKNCRLTWQLGVTQVPYPQFDQDSISAKKSKLRVNLGEKSQKKLKEIIKMSSRPILNF